MTQNRLALSFIVMTVALDAIGIGLIFPVMPALMEEITGQGLSEAALWGGLISTSFAVTQFLFGPMIGNLSDRFGRRPILLTSVAIVGIDYVVMALTQSLWVLLAARVVAGIASATHSTANAYIADITPPDQRARFFGLLGAGFGVGFVLGPLIGGVLAGIDTRAPFWAAAGLCALNFGLGAFALPESLSRANRRPFQWRRANPLGAFLALRVLRGVKAFLSIHFLYALTFTVYPAVWTYYGIAAFGWSTAMVGVSLAVYGISLALVQAFAVAPVIRRFGERRTVLWGMFIEVAAFAFLGLATNGMLVLIMTPVTALGGIAEPALRSLFSRAIPPDQQGEWQGAVSAVSALTMILGPMIFTASFAVFTAPAAPLHLPGAPFLLALVVMVAAIVVFVAGMRETDRQTANPVPKAEDTP
jgi:DHA1 family tetracycline resistance protein-like MFS transporter